MDLHDAARVAAEAVRQRQRDLGRPPRWLIACDTDADGVCGAAVVAAALRREGHQFQVRGSRQKDEAAYLALAREEGDGFVVVDKGTSHLPTLEAMAGPTGRPVIVIDHHNLQDSGVPKNVVLVNPRAVGLDGGRDASSSTTAVAVALQLAGDDAFRWAATGLCGAIGDWQHMGGWQGWNAELIERAEAAGHLQRRKQPAFIGVTLAHALAHRPEPQVPGLQDDVPAARAFLARLGIDPDVEVEDLDAEVQTRLLSAVTLRCIEEGVEGTQRLVLETLVHPRFDTSLRHVFRLVDACGREGAVGTGVAMLLGDPAARDAAEGHFRNYKQAIGTGIQRLREEGTRRLDAVQHLQIDDAAYTGMVAGIGMTHLVGDTAVPICVTADRVDGQVQVSTRGSHAQVEAGMDLGAACNAAAAAVGREGGGHPIAAGAVVGADDVESFLLALDEALTKQGWLAPT